MATLTADGLTMPAPGADVLREVMNRSWRTLAAEYLSEPFASRPERLGVPAIVRAGLDRDPRAFVRVLRTPMIAGLLGAARRSGSIEERAALAHELELCVLTECATRGLLVAPVEVETNARVTLRAIAWRGAAEVDAGTALRFGPEGVQRRVGSACVPVPSTPAFHPIAGGFFLATSDSNPLLPVQAHPERAGNAVDLGGASVEEWTRALSEAFTLIGDHDPEMFAEMRLALELVVPVGHDPERHFSVSYRDSVGAVYLTLHPKPLTLVEALVHEFQHNKLNAAMRFDALLVNSSTPEFASPVRPDPRPLLGVLMAAHAFLPVARLLDRMLAAGHPLSRGHDFASHRDAIVRMNDEAVNTVLRHARPTPFGKGLLAELARVNAGFAR